MNPHDIRTNIYARRQIIFIEYGFIVERRLVARRLVDSLDERTQKGYHVTTNESIGDEIFVPLSREPTTSETMLWYR